MKSDGHVLGGIERTLKSTPSYDFGGFHLVRLAHVLASTGWACFGASAKATAPNRKPQRPHERVRQGIAKSVLTSV
jgi:hypothetical protein